MNVDCRPIYTLISIKVPTWVHKVMDKIMKVFLWVGSDVVQAGKCLVAWPKVQRPLCLGGLGVLDLQSMGISLRMRWLWLQRVNTTHPWSSMPVEEDMVTKSFFKASVRWEIGKGDCIKFWSDSWLHDQSITDIFPQLVTAVPARRRRDHLLGVALAGDSWIRDITGALTAPVLSQYLQLRALITDVSRSDCLVWV
jgi:hypothetical protein